ncbi:MAG: hypothetical protein EHM90_06130, partial [Chloroflexi bacterium]
MNDFEHAELVEAEAEVMDQLVSVYGDTDWSGVMAWMAANPGSESNPNVMMIPLSLANVYLNRFERNRDAGDLERATRWAEWVAANHVLWGERWLTGAVAGYLTLTAYRLREHALIDGYGDRMSRLVNVAVEVLAVEANARLAADLPYRVAENDDPYDSSQTGDTKAEENAWEAGLLATAAVFAPDDPNAATWERKARQLAYDALSAPGDPPDADGIKTTTINADYFLSNHHCFPNPYYTGATLLLLTQGALMYRLAGRPIPVEFSHNVGAVHAVYRSMIDGHLEWTESSDPSGDATLFPLAYDADLEVRAVARRLGEGYLWKPTSPVSQMTVGDVLWTAVMNSKVVYVYLVGSYLWHAQPGSPEPPVPDLPVCTAPG